jgi:hypothetical protein
MTRSIHMKTVLCCLYLSALIAAPVSFAAAPAGAPAGSRGLCKDGSYSTSAEKQGACRGHKGVKEWYGDEATAAPMSKVGAASVPSTAASTGSSMKSSGAATPSQAAPGGGAGQVWANDSTKVYHCSGDRYYGKTKKGEYMSEAAAKAKGFRPDHGKVCG